MDTMYPRQCYTSSNILKYMKFGKLGPNKSFPLLALLIEHQCKQGLC